MNPRPVLAGTIVAVLVAGIAVAVVRPGDLGGDGRTDAAAPTTTTPADRPTPEPEGTDVPRTTTPAGSGVDGAGGTVAPTPSSVPTTAPAVPTTSSPAPFDSPAPAPADGRTRDSQRPPTLADTGGSPVLAPLAVALLVAGSVGRHGLRARGVEPTT